MCTDCNVAFSVGSVFSGFGFAKSATWPATWPGWLPRWLDRLLPNVDVEGAELERNHPQPLR